jgi:hypothetical protein
MLSAVQLGAQKCDTPPANAEWVKAQRASLVEGPAKWTNDTLRALLLTSAGLTADAPLQMGWQVPDSIKRISTDSVGIAAIREMTRTRGGDFPNRPSVGVAGMRAVWLLAQSDTTLMRTVMHRMMEAGPDMGIPTDIAMLDDRGRLMAGRKQLYATQLHFVGGVLVPYPTEDSAHVDMRRKTAQLPPLAWSVCNAKRALSK